MFKIELSNPEWLDTGLDNPEDLCLHGNVKVYIDERVLEDSCTVSASAMYFLKSITEDHIAGNGIQFLPCCGHGMFADEKCKNVTIIGCSNGTDWTVKHEENSVLIELKDGYKTSIPLEEYKKAVFDFADEIETFYKLSSPKKIYTDYDKDGYIAMWNEWHRRRGKIIYSCENNIVIVEQHSEMKTTVKSYSEIQSIDKNGLLFKDGTSIDFSKCVNKKNYSGNSIAEREIIANPPYFEFYNDEKIRIVFDKKGLFAKNKNQKDFIDFQKIVNNLGYKTFDLS